MRKMRKLLVVVLVLAIFISACQNRQIEDTAKDAMQKAESPKQPVTESASKQTAGTNVPNQKTDDISADSIENDLNSEDIGNVDSLLEDVENI